LIYEEGFHACRARRLQLWLSSFSLGQSTPIMPHLRSAAAIGLCLFAACALALGAHNPTYAEKKFKKLLADRIGRLWYASMETHRKQLVPGVVRIHVAVSPKRKILELRMTSNPSNKLSALLIMDAIRHAEIPSVPPELLIRGAYRDDYTFKIYAQ
jgi:hypothetical protein